MSILGDHEAVISVNEPLTGFYLTPFLCDTPGVDASALDTSTFSLRLTQQSSTHFFAEEFSGIWVPGLGRLMRERLLAQLSSIPPARRPLSRLSW